METNPRYYGERYRFDAFCKTVLKHEAIDYIREMKRQASRETSLERLPQTAMNKLCSADDYPSDSTTMCSRIAAVTCRSEASRWPTPLPVCRNRSKAF